MATKFEPIKYVVPGIVVEGLTLLAGKPKGGKSWLMLHAAIAVASGGFTLGEIHCIQGDVLYCALEDNPRRLQSRLKKLLGSQPGPERLHFMCEMPRLADGGLDKIRAWIDQAPHARLVIIDTLAMVRVARKRDETTYDADYAAVKELRSLCNERGVAIVAVHHLRKQEADDVFDTVSGTLGLTGAVDTVLVLRRDTQGRITLHGRGRDMPEFEKAVAFNSDACTWTILGDAVALRANKDRKAVLNMLSEATEPASPTAIAASTSLNHANLRKLLARMCEDGLIERTDRGKYRAREAAPVCEL